MDEIEYSFDELCKLENKILTADKKRKKFKLLNKTVKLYKKLAQAEERLTLPNRTKADFKRRTKILTEICELFRTDAESSALDDIKNEARLLNELYGGLKRVFEEILLKTN